MHFAEIRRPLDVMSGGLLVFCKKGFPQMTQIKADGEAGKGSRVAGSEPEHAGDGQTPGGPTSAPDPRTHAIIGAAMEVHTTLGNGFLEAVYQEALAIEFCRRGIPCRREVNLVVEYKGQVLSVGYRADFVCYDEIVVELKALEEIGDNEKGIVINYLKACHYQLGLLLNFGAPRLQYRRIVWSRSARSGKKASANDADEGR